MCYFSRKLGWDSYHGEDDQDVNLREMLLVALVKLGHDKTINEGVRRFDVLIHNHDTSILSSHTRTVYSFPLLHMVLL